MKYIFMPVMVFLLTGCMFGTSSEIRKAEKLFDQFHCNNIETSQMGRSSITSFHEHKLASSKQKAQSYIQSYKQGEHLFDLPLEQVIEQQFFIYKAACQNLGGIQP
jgi:hypothetical protein